MMVQPCCYCGIPLQRAAQYVGIADVILGLINFIFMVIHVKELFEFGNTLSAADDELYSSSSSYYTRRENKYRGRTFPGLDFLPRELALFICICHGVQFLMGTVLYISAVNKNRNVCLFWMGVTAVTALFTGLFIRLYEMLIVNEFVHELKLEQEVTYFPGQNPIQPQQQLQQPPTYQHQQAQPVVGQQPMGNPLVPSADTHVSVITIPTVTPSPYNNMGAPELYPGGGYYAGGQYPSAPYPQYQQQHAPAALQPPPYYEVAGNNGDAGGSSNRSSTGYPVESVLFPSEKNEYRNSFSKF